MTTSPDLSFNVFEADQQLSSPHPTNRPIGVQSRRPFSGQYDFHLDFKGADLVKDYKLYTGQDGKRILFVYRNRPFVIRTLFRLPLTPANLYIRLIPLFTALPKRSEAVFRCPNHAHNSALKSPGISVPSPAESPCSTDASRCLICIQNLHARHRYLEGHLTVLLPLDQRLMAMDLKPPSPCRHEKHCRASSGSGGRGDNSPHSTMTVTSLHLENSQSSPEGCTSSYPMGVATADLVCRLGCYNSCFGGQHKGGIEIVVRLEELPEDPRLPPIVHGLDCVEIHCSATPARDIKNYTENITEAAKKVSANHHSYQRKSTSGVKSSSSPLIDCSSCRGRLSVPSVVISDTASDRGSSRSKRCLALVGDNLSAGVDADNDGIVSQSSTSSSAVAPVTDTPDFVECLDSRGVKVKYYLVVTRSKERAKRFRIEDDALEAFSGSRMSSSRFASNRAECLRAQKRIVQLCWESSENCQPPQ